VIAVEKPGLLTTVQDAGRPGLRAFGMPLAGALDRHAHALANLLAGNPPGAAALELTLLGGTFRFVTQAYVALSGADMGATLDGAPLPTWSAFPVREGSVLALGPAVDGVRAYLAVRGGIDVPLVLGSRSTYLRARVGGLEGRAVRAGDLVRTLPAAPLRARRMPPEFVPTYRREATLRVVLGPQDDLFLPEGVATFLGSAYTVTNRNDRMGYELEGPAVRHARGPDIVSDGLIPGAVQVPGSGAPFVLMADCQTVGGYTKIATIIGPDLPAMAQTRRGDVVRFVRCTPAQADAALRRERALLARAAAILTGGGA
jgi:biotin-dependent carboxylase-like uncharacterized protein